MKKIIKITLVILFIFIFINIPQFILKIQSPVCWLSDNFHMVEKGKFYRSKQLTTEALSDYIKKYQIKTILNLREKEEDATALQQEDNFAKKRGINFVNIPLSPCHLPSKEEIEKILELFEAAEKPILVHCWSGSDRTGMVSALWALEEMQQPLQEALKQLAFRFGHVKIFHPSMTKFIELWTNLRKTKSQNGALMIYEQANYDEPFSILHPLSFFKPCTTK